MFKLVVLSCLMAAASAQWLGYSAYSPYAYSAGFYNPYYNYRGPLSLAPGQPANILGADGRPLDTLDVNLDRSAHLTAKAYKAAGIHVLKKRSAPVFVAPIRPLAYAHTPLIARPLAYSYPAPIAHVAPYSYATPYFRAL